MGNPASKAENEIRTQEEKTPEGSLPSTPILTPRTRVIDLDPRSPSANIVRTPIEVILTPNRKAFSEAKNSSEGILDDPRSPTTDFTRTPIVIYNKADPSLPIKLYNKNLDNVRKTITPYSPTSMRTKNTPKLLESSPIIPKPISIKRRSFAGLLETNLDFVETDLDSVMKRKVPEEKPGDEEQALNKIEEINFFESVEDNSEIKENEAGKTTASEALKTEAEGEENVSSSVNIKDFNKKLTNLIYEDDEVINTTIKNIVISEGNRTPLGERNSNTDNNQKKSMPRLRVSDKPKRFDKEMSKIPVFKDKRTKGKLRQSQCENVPPSNMNDSTLSKPKAQKWDQNNTLII